MTNERLEEIALRVNAATPGPWFAAASSVHSEPLSREYDRVERDIPEDAPVEAYAALPNSCVATVPVVSGDTPTARGVSDAAFIAHAREDIPALIAEVVRLESAAQRWIPVTERLPEEGIGVLIHGGETNALVGWFYGDKGWQDHAYDDIEGVTHWMPLPASPTSEKER